MRPVPGSILGIDVSHHQSRIDWQAVAAARTKWGRVEWAYAKATEGATHRDKRFVENAVDAARAGIPLGAYHWIRPGHNTPAAEAGNFLRAIRDARAAGGKVELAPMIDLEEAPPASISGPQAMLDYVNEFALAVQAELGQRPVLYVGSNFARQHLDLRLPALPMPIWIPAYNRPSCNYAPETTGPKVVNAATRDWSIWQFCSKGEIPGIKGDVDLNALRGDRRDAIGLSSGPFSTPEGKVLFSIGGVLLLLVVIVWLAMRAA